MKTIYTILLLLMVSLFFSCGDLPTGAEVGDIYETNIYYITNSMEGNVTIQLSNDYSVYPTDGNNVYVSNEFFTKQGAYQYIVYREVTVPNPYYDLGWQVLNEDYIFLGYEGCASFGLGYGMTKLFDSNYFSNYAVVRIPLYVP